MIQINNSVIFFILLIADMFTAVTNHKKGTILAHFLGVSLSEEVQIFEGNRRSKSRDMKTNSQIIFIFLVLEVCCQKTIYVSHIYIVSFVYLNMRIF